MSEEQTGGVIKDTIEAVTGLVQAVPVYEDAIQPAAKEVGKSLLTVAKTINVVLAPISALVWGYEKIEGFINERLNKKLENVPEENIITPDPAIVGPSLEALRFSGNNEELREMYANLIANSMDSNTANNTHPGFVEIIKNMNSAEARILKHIGPVHVLPVIIIRSKANPDADDSIIHYKNLSVFKEIDVYLNQTLIPSYLDNLQRLGLLEIDYGNHLTAVSEYQHLLDSSIYLEYQKVLSEANRFIDHDKGILKLTALGRQFQLVCINEK